MDLFNNPLSNEEDDFRAKVFKMLPNLAFLDGTDANDEEDDEDSEFEDGVAPGVEEESSNGDGVGGGGKISHSGGKNGNVAEEEDGEEEEGDDGESKEGLKKSRGLFLSYLLRRCIFLLVLAARWRFCQSHWEK